MVSNLLKMATTVVKMTAAAAKKAPAKKSTSTTLFAGSTTKPKAKTTQAKSVKPAAAKSGYSSSGSYARSGGGGGGTTTTKTSSTTSSTTKNTTKATDAARKAQVNDLTKLLQTSASGGMERLELALTGLLGGLEKNRALAQNQYAAVADTLQSGFEAQMGVLDDITESTLKAVDEETTTTGKEWGRMLREVSEQLSEFGVGESDALTAKVQMNVDRALGLNSSLRGGFDTINSRNQQAASAYTDASSAMTDLNNSFDRELAELLAAYETDANNRANAEYANQADLYKQIASAWGQLGLEYAQKQDEAAGQKVTTTTTTKGKGFKTVNTDKATNKIQSSMSSSALKKAKADAEAKAKAAFESANIFAGKAPEIKAPSFEGAKSNFKPELSKSTLEHNFDINENQARTTAGKRVSGSTLKWG